MKLADLKNGEKAVIVKIKGHGAFRKRITEMGFVKGKLVEVVKNAPLKDPIEYKIMGYSISLRRSEAELIEVVSQSEAELISSEYNGVIDEKTLKTSAKKKEKIINVALVGNPNCGKTTLYNFISNSHESVGNYSGVTVDSKTSEFQFKDYKFNIADLPGTYSLTAYTPEELYVRVYILNERPDIVINVVDASNLERNLYLTTQLIDMDIKVVIALNMYDELQKRGDKLDYDSLGKLLGIPIIPTVAAKGEGIDNLFEEVIKVYEDKEPIVRHIHVKYSKGIEKAIKELQVLIRENQDITNKMSPRFLAIKLLENDEHAHKILRKANNYEQIKKTSKKLIKKLESHFGEDLETIISEEKYGFISGALRETYSQKLQAGVTKSDIIDTFLTHQLFGFPIFILFMWVMFQGTFTLGAYPMQWLDMFVGTVGELVSKYMPAGILHDLIVDGVIGGVGGVIVFLPNILILFFFISFMEDTGYMARAAFIMDKIMHKIGLHGKSFIPLIMGFGCNVPAIMSTRTIENRTDRILTILINPFMSCSARLPVYILITSAFFPEHGANIIFLIYITGILLAGIMAVVFRKIFFKKEETPFVMELPPYRMPTMRVTLKHMWHKGAQYLQKMGGIILIASIIIWALGYFPRTSPEIDKIKNQISEIDKRIEIQKDSSLLKHKTALEYKLTAVHQENSYIGRIGRSIEPLMAPLGFDSKMSVSLLTGIVAKEIVVSTMGVLYQAGDKSQTLVQKLKAREFTSGDKKGQKVFTKVTALAFLIFILIYFPCVATIAAVKRETGSWRWALFMMSYTTALAWILAFAVYQIGNFIF